MTRYNHRKIGIRTKPIDWRFDRRFLRRVALFIRFLAVLFGVYDFNQHWPAPAADPKHTELSKRTNVVPRKVRQNLPQSSRLGLFDLPLEIRMKIFALVFPFKTIHLAKTYYKSPEGLQVCLQAYPCVIDVPHKEHYMCKCILSPNEKNPRRSHRGGRNLDYDRHEIDTRPVSAFPGIRTRDSDSGAGLWELMGAMYASKAFCEGTLTSVLQSRGIQVFDLDTIILASICMPRRHFDSIRSLYLNAKYIAPRTSFTSSISHFPPAYQRFFSDAPLVPAPTNDLPQSDMYHIEFPRPRSTSNAPSPSAWSVVCQILSRMQSLDILRLQLCHSAFSEVLFRGLPKRVVSNEEWVFEPLVDIVKKRGRPLSLFEVEVDWPDGGDGWDGAKRGLGFIPGLSRDLGFDLVRVGPRARGW